MTGPKGPVAMVNTADSGLAGTSVDRPVSSVLLWRLFSRRDRVLIPVWLAVLVATSYVQVTATIRLYSSEASRLTASRAINASPGIVAIYGPILDPTSLGEFAMTKMTVTYAVLVSIMLLFIVRRHTRLDEESGRVEMLTAGAITASSPLRVAVAYGCAVSLIIGSLVAMANTLGGLPLTGSLAFGAVWTGTGLVAVGVTAVACQLSASSRTCAAIASTAFGALYIFRAIGDSGRASWLSWISPYGWNTRVQAYGETRWPLLVLYPALGGLLVVVTMALQRSRDVGSGVVQPRAGSAVGSSRLTNLWALELRLHAPMLIGWTLAVATTGVVMGSITSSMESFSTPEVNDMLARLGGRGDMVDTMFTAIIVIYALIATAFGITITTHMAADEQSGRTDHILATTTSRVRLFTTMTLLAMGGSTWILLVTGTSLTLGMRGGSTHSTSVLIASSLAPAPAIWTVVGICILMLAINSRWASAGWAFLLFFATLGQIGDFIGLPQWMADISPYAHIPKVPQESFSLAPMLALSATAVGIVLVAWFRYRTRDIN